MPPIGNARPEFTNTLNEVRIDMDEVDNSRAKNEDGIIMDLKRKIGQLSSEVERLQRHSNTNRKPWK